MEDLQKKSGLVRIEGKLEKLTAAITDLAQVVGKMKVSSFVEP